MDTPAAAHEWDLLRKPPELLIVPVTRQSLVAFAIATLASIVPLLLTMMPVGELVKMVLSVLR